MKVKYVLGWLLFAGLLSQTDVKAQNFTQLWQVGTDNNSQSEFGQEVGGPTGPPGSPTIKDDDYYFAGIYPPPINAVAMNEPFANFERAILVVDPRVRIHFNLADIHAAPAAQMRLLVDVCCSNHGGDLGFTGPIPFTALFNGVQIMAGTTSGINDQNELFTATPFTAASVNATTGENIVTIERPTDMGGNWMQFDFIRLEVDTNTLGCDKPICSFGATRTFIQPGESTTLNWVTRAGSTLVIDNGVGSVNTFTVNGVGSIQVSPMRNTTYTLTSTQGAVTEMASVTIGVDIITTFTSSAIEVPAGVPVTLNWNTDPSATLTIDQGIGSVPAGVSSIEVTPIELETTYTMTATRGPDMEVATVRVFSNPFSRLWTVGDDNGNQSEFGQETGGANAPPGSPVAKDDDWYFAGIYPDPIGIVPTNEPLANFERALLKGDPTNRIHFNLTGEQADPTALFRVRVEVCCVNHANPVVEGQAIDYSVSINNVLLLETTTNGIDGAEELVFTPAKSGQELSMGTGDNVVTIERKTNQGGNWMQFDLVSLETMPGIPTEIFQITEIQFSPGSGQLQVTWASRPGHVYAVETSGDLVTWGELTDNAVSGGTRTSFSTVVDYAMFPKLFVRVRNLGRN